jgi:predicted O-methyltransferase YrrM
MITAPEVNQYLSQVNPPTDPLILEMERSGRERGFPIIGPQVGRLCELLARSIGARSVYEMGSGFGYSTWWFSRAVGESGSVVHSDGSEKLSAEARQWMTRAGLEGRVRFEVGDARELLAREDGPFDVIFCDIDKEGYPEALELARPRLRKGGLLIVDNTIWGGRVALPDPDETTRAIQQFNDAAAAADDLLTVILPLRDGVSVSLKL